MAGWGGGGGMRAERKRDEIRFHDEHPSRMRHYNVHP